MRKNKLRSLLYLSIVSGMMMLGYFLRGLLRQTVEQEKLDSLNYSQKMQNIKK